MKRLILFTIVIALFCGDAYGWDFAGKKRAKGIARFEIWCHNRPDDPQPPSWFTNFGLLGLCDPPLFDDCEVDPCPDSEYPRQPGSPNLPAGTWPMVRASITMRGQDSWGNWVIGNIYKGLDGKVRKTDTQVIPDPNTWGALEKGKMKYTKKFELGCNGIFTIDFWGYDITRLFVGALHLTTDFYGKEACHFIAQVCVISDTSINPCYPFLEWIWYQGIRQTNDPNHLRPGWCSTSDPNCMQQPPPLDSETLLEMLNLENIEYEPSEMLSEIEYVSKHPNSTHFVFNEQPVWMAEKMDVNNIQYEWDWVDKTYPKIHIDSNTPMPFMVLEGGRIYEIFEGNEIDYNDVPVSPCFGLEETYGEGVYPPTRLSHSLREYGRLNVEFIVQFFDDLPEGFDYLLFMLCFLDANDNLVVGSPRLCPIEYISSDTVKVTVEQNRYFFFGPNGEIVCYGLRNGYFPFDYDGYLTLMPIWDIDINGDGIDFRDYAIWLSYWPTYDLNKDGYFDWKDVSIFCESWLK